MTRGLAASYSLVWRAALVLLTLEIAIVSLLRYFTDLAPPPAAIVANLFANPFLLLHVLGGVTALLVGPLQFVAAIRKRWPRFHRLTGRLYVLACAVGAPAGLMLALGTTAGPVAGAGFAMLALLWPIFTWLGWRAAMERRLDVHREWMLRSYAMAATAITLRLMLPAAAFLGLDFLSSYRVIAWLSWIANLLLFESYIRWTRRPSTAFGRLATA